MRGRGLGHRVLSGAMMRTWGLIPLTVLASAFACGVAPSPTDDEPGDGSGGSSAGNSGGAHSGGESGSDEGQAGAGGSDADGGAPPAPDALGAFPHDDSVVTKGGTITFTNIGAPGWWPRRLDREAGDPACTYKDGTD